MTWKHSRGKCVVPTCNTKQVKWGWKGGKQRYHKYCSRHQYQFKKGGIISDTCSVCGWNKTSCDRHRLIPEKGYIKGNVVVLCPNCHRMVSEGKLEL